MTPEGEKELLALMRRIASHVAPEKPERPKHTAVLGTATYSREERARQEIRDKLRGDSPKAL